MKVLLTGGTGFLGRAVARALIARGHDLRLLVRGGRRPGLPEAAEVVAGDTADADGFRRAAEGCGAVIHLAALVKMWVPEREEFDRVNVGGFRNALAAARSASARLLYTSSFIALGPTAATPADESQVHPGTGFRNDYERTKAKADREATAAGDVIALYPGVIYGPGELTDANIVVKMLLDHARGRLPALVGPGDRLWSYAFVDDVAEGHAQALEKGVPGQRYLLGGENATLTRLFELIEETAGLPPPRHHLPYGVGTAAGWALWLWAELTGRPPELTPGVVGVFREHWALSSAKAERDLGYASRGLFDGLSVTVEWLRAEGHLAG